MKRFLAFVLSAALWVVALAGCTPAPASSGSESVSTPQAEATPVPTPSATPAPTATPLPTATPEPLEYTPGVRTDSSYTNSTLGLHFTLTQNMVMATDEEIAAMVQGSTDLLYGDMENGDQIIAQGQLTTNYEMIAVDIVTGSTVIIATEQLPMDGITEEQYIRASKEQLEAIDLPVDLVYEDPGTVTLGETDFTGLTYTLYANGAQASQTLLLKNIGGQMCLISFSYTDPAEYQNLLACFHVISAV